MRKNFKGHYQNPKTNLNKGQKKADKVKYRPIIGSVLFHLPGEPVVYQFSERANSFPEFHNYMNMGGYNHEMVRAGLQYIPGWAEYFKQFPIYRVEEKDIQQVIDDFKMIGITIKIRKDYWS